MEKQVLGGKMRATEVIFLSGKLTKGSLGYCLHM